MAPSSTRTVSTVVVDEGVYARIMTKVDPEDGVFVDFFYALRVEADRDLTEAEARHLAGLIGYAYAAEIRGERLGWHGDERDYLRDTSRSLVFSADSTKTRSDDLGIAWEHFVEVAQALVYEGTPVRKTDRSGLGTKGTRLIEPMDSPVRLSFWVDNAFVEGAATHGRVIRAEG